MDNPVIHEPAHGVRPGFADLLARLLADELFHPLPLRPGAIHLAGDCIEDTTASSLAAGSDPAAGGGRLVLWGCGLRSREGLGERDRARCEILAVRGPLTREALGLGDSVPVGEPALFLPALHPPRRDPRTAGRTLCLADARDPRPDAELLRASRCEVVLRPGLPPTREGVRALADAIASAEFVLSASLPGAALAAAYGRPFARWNDGRGDGEFPWADFSASIGIESRCAADLPEGRALHAEAAAALRLPPLWPVLAAAPLAIRADAALQVLAHERGSLDAAALRDALAELRAAQRAALERHVRGEDAAEAAARPSRALSLGPSPRAGGAAARADEALGIGRELAAVARSTWRTTIALEREIAILRAELEAGWLARLARRLRATALALVEGVRARNRARLARRAAARRALVDAAPVAPVRPEKRGLVAWLRAKNRTRLARRKARHRVQRAVRDATLELGAGAAPPLPPQVANRSGPRVLFVDSVFPKPDRDSGSVTARFLVDIFLELGWQVTFHADAERNPDARYVDALESAGVRCLRPRDEKAFEQFLEQEGDTFSLCMLFRVYSGGRHLELVRKRCRRAKVVFETVDLHFLREERQARVLGDRRGVNLALGLKERELYVARSADVAIVVSEFEHRLLEQEVPGVRAMTLPLILDCPGRTAPFSARAGICFVGGYLHQPNVDAVHFFLDEIWPRVLERLPRAVFHVVGSDLPDELRARASASVVPVGWVEDLDGFLAKMRLTVAPLRYGAGVKGKIGSSLANGVPCVATSLAAEGMGLAAEEAIAVADDPAEFAARVAALHEDEAAWTRMSDAGWRHVSDHYSLDAARARIVRMLSALDLPAWPTGATAEDASPAPRRSASRT